MVQNVLTVIPTNIIFKTAYIRFLFLLISLLLLSRSSSGYVSRQGVLKMCPPGGESFATAWQLTCGMRKKRSIDLDDNIEKNKETGTVTGRGI